MRHRILTLLLGLAVLVTAGCGFNLRGTTQVPPELQKLLLESSDPYGPLTRAIRQQLRLSNVTIVDDPMRKDLPILRIIGSSQSQNTVSVFRNGVTAEYQLVLHVQAQVLIPGHDIYPIQVNVFRTFFDNPLTALAKAAEADVLRQEMRDQAAQQLVRKLLVVHAAEVQNARENGDALTKGNTAPGAAKTAVVEEINIGKPAVSTPAQ
ncbi:lipopolysaccharide-assembly family protein [Yersinia rochesterensis]|uniref:LPS-assembly lipoprotein LptE n=1 Tax=Yersinia rochesterensis TaxID=1604335 RepID=A0ABM5SJR1_9GAMM|nr:MULTISPECIES: LPS assembly lipoprotein LptE [Yersinia]AJI88471.1 lipopolysaccharide-assembly family protein [Yersinia frederiksenii Y225]CNG98485.1 LPS-assembly lipoprotein RlpB [Yersinia kristensenii]AIN18429.1 lipopolysaccharide-assembly family protein [Yersinia rochesterensis]AJJ34762.1 lipopolysaccharide-assembly family protein [Yersinia rochesterensis]CRY59843.1 LPS-assembly lipoprotein RlpB [Yersinia kristensenii]